MKKFVLSIFLVSLALGINAQASVDALFKKYAGKDGFVTVTINGSLLKLIESSDKDDDSGLGSANITEIRILAQDDDDMKVENFYDLVMKDIDLNLYEEFMRVKEAHQDLRMLVRTEGDRFREFLLIAGGEDNALIQVKGNMSLEDAKKFSDHAKKDHGADLTGNR